MPYVIERGGTTSAPLGYFKVLARVRKMGTKAGPRHRYRRPEASVSPPVFLVKLLGRLTIGLPLSKPGQVWWITHGTRQPERDNYRIKKIPRPPRHRPLINYLGNEVNLADGNPRIAEVGQWAADTYERVRSVGYAYTRPVEGTSTWSQHSRFDDGCNAIDLTFYRGDEAGPVDEPALDLFVQTLVREARMGTFRLRRIIYKSADYRDDHGWSPIKYKGEYHSSHTHAEAEPYQTSRPVDA